MAPLPSARGLPRQPLAQRRRWSRSRIGRWVGLSLLLHLVVGLLLLMGPFESLPPEAMAPQGVEVELAPAGAPEAPEPPKPNAPATSPLAGAPAQPAVEVPPVPPPPPPPPEPAPPKPHEEAAVRVPMPDLLPPVEMAPLPPPPPIPQPAQPPRPAVRRDDPLAHPVMQSWNFAANALPRPSPSPSRPARSGTGVDLALGPEARNARGAPPRPANGHDADITVEGAQVGGDWMELLHEWWARHGYYPEMAAAQGEDGDVQIHVAVDRSGHVHGVELISRSGSQWLDMGALATFRGATLPPFPPSTPEDNADLKLTIHYILVRR